jgi:hypothetical protein
MKAPNFEVIVRLRTGFANRHAQLATSRVLGGLICCLLCGIGVVCAGTERQRGGASWDSSGEDENSPVRRLNQGNSTLNYTLCDYYGLMFTIAGCNSQRVPTWADPRPRPIAL